MPKKLKKYPSLFGAVTSLSKYSMLNNTTDTSSINESICFVSGESCGSVEIEKVINDNTIKTWIKIATILPIFVSGLFSASSIMLTFIALSNVLEDHLKVCIYSLT